MANFQYVTSFLTSSTVTATDTLSGYQAVWARDFTQPFRGWRSANVASQKILSFDAGSVQDLSGIGVFSCNTPDIELQMSVDNSIWTGLPGFAQSHIFNPQLFQGVFSFFISFAIQTQRAIRVVIPTGQTLRNKTNTGYYETTPAYNEIGTVFWCKTVNTLTRNPTRDMSLKSSTGEEEATLTSGRTEIQRVGFPHSTFNLNWQNLSATERAEIRAITAIGKANPVLWFINQGAPEQMLWAHLTGEPSETTATVVTNYATDWRTLT